MPDLAVGLQRSSFAAIGLQILSQCLPFRLTCRIQIRFFPNTHRTMPQALAQPLIIRRRGMIHAPIVPDGHIIWILPPMTHLQVVIFDNQPHEPFQQGFRFQRRYSVNLLYVFADRKDGFPSRDGVGPDHGMDGFELVADVVGRTSRTGKHTEPAILGCFAEFRLRVGSGQGLEESLVGGGKAVEEFVTRRPECICKRVPLAIGTERPHRRGFLPPPVPGSSTSRRTA